MYAGSNSVNVFFGIGVPWLIAAIYWAGNGPTEEWQRRYENDPLVWNYAEILAAGGGFVVKSGDLGFSVREPSP